MRAPLMIVAGLVGLATPVAAAATVGVVAGKDRRDRASPAVAGAPPPFVVPVGGSLHREEISGGGERTVLLRADGTLFAERETDFAGRPVRERYDLGHDRGVEVNADYVEEGSGDSTAPAPAQSAPHGAAARRPSANSASCGSDDQNPNADRWTTTLRWYWVSSSTPAYLDPTNTLASLRNAFTEWVTNENWCLIADASALASSYQGTTVSAFGQNSTSTVDWGSIAALNLSGCSSPNTIGCTLRWFVGTQSVEADVRLDDTGRTTWYNGNASGKTDVQSLMAHEVGHMIAFGHVPDSTNVMYGTIYTNDVSNRKLGRGDANANNAKY